MRPYVYQYLNANATGRKTLVDTVLVEARKHEHLDAASWTPKVIRETPPCLLIRAKAPPRNRPSQEQALHGTGPPRNCPHEIPSRRPAHILGRCLKRELLLERTLE